MDVDNEKSAINVSPDDSSLLARLSFGKTELIALSVLVVLEILMVILANSRLNNLDDDETIGRFTNSDSSALTNYMLLMAAIVVILVLTAIIARNQKFVKRFAIIFALVFGYALTSSLYHSTGNYILMYFSAIYLTSVYWYYFHNGEVATFLDNRVVIFSLRRSFAIIPMFFVIAMITFLGINFIGDPVEIAVARVRFSQDVSRQVLLQRYGLLDDNGQRIPVWTRFWTWLYDFFQGDLGISYERLKPVTEQIGLKLFETLKMQVTALVIAFTLSIVIGMLAAYYHRTLADSTISAVALLGLSMPIFVSGILAILIFGGTGLNWFPAAKAHSVESTLINKFGCELCEFKPGEYYSEQYDPGNFTFWKNYLTILAVYTWDSIWHLVLPVLTLAFATMATYSRLTRSTMLEVMRQDYILAARANGLSERDILTRHALRNVTLPLVTFLGINIGTLLVGAPITETVFSWPGLGLYFVESLVLLDIPIVMALTMIITLMILFANLLTDIAYSYLDPRITL